MRRDDCRRFWPRSVAGTARDAELAAVGVDAVVVRRGGRREALAERERSEYLPRTMLSFDNLPTRERSLMAALEVVRQQGLPELTTRAIARTSGLTQPAIYRYFARKEELVSEVLGEIRGLFYERLEEIPAELSAEDRLMRALEAFRDFAVEEPKLYDALFFQTSESVPAPPPIDRQRGGNIFGFLVERVSECAREGLVRREGRVAAALSLAAHSQGLVLLYRQGRFGSRDRFADFYRRSTSTLLRGLR
ncbi:MAG: TetR family transcriptional regulator [Gemmatimonas sp.]|nr:TetR family transcriptional regulator [Gemmatimonas sp.]